uniref:Uncharacterized protein n=1 Tax=Lotus japonicus TaxID=34305 RepID=I3T824_LOTJA|nr:unknown [Lotus japonicus]
MSKDFGFYGFNFARARAPTSSLLRMMHKISSHQRVVENRSVKKLRGGGFSFHRRREWWLLRW